jgi:hypothetical protein
VGRTLEEDAQETKIATTEKGRPYGKLNCTTLEQAGESDQAVIGTLNILTHPGKVLFDTGATTSFLAQGFVEKYWLRCSKLEYPITVLSVGERS